MRKGAMFILGLAAFLLLSSCGTAGETNSQEPPPESEKEALVQAEEGTVTDVQESEAVQPEAEPVELCTPLTEAELTAFAQTLQSNSDFLETLEWYDPIFGDPPVISVHNGWLDSDGCVHLEYRTRLNYPPDLYEAVLVPAEDGQWTFGSAGRAHDMTVTDEPDGRVLAAAELEEMEQWFRVQYDSSEPSMRMQYLTSAYRAPEEIGLYELFYNGCIEDQIWTVYTHAPEEEQMAALGYLTTIDLTKATTASMDESLRNHMGIGLEDTLGYGLEDLIYVPEYDAYYNEHGDTNNVSPKFLCGWEMEDGSLRLRYENFFETMEVCLVPKDDGDWYFLWNLWVDS